MCAYTFWAGSVKGLNEEVKLIADNYEEALKAVNKHIARQRLHLVSTEEVVKVSIECIDCGQYYEGYEHIDCKGHKDLSKDTLVHEALNHDNRYRKFKRLHSHHSMQEGGWLKADGAIL